MYLEVSSSPSYVCILYMHHVTSIARTFSQEARSERSLERVSSFNSCNCVVLSQNLPRRRALQRNRRALPRTKLQIRSLQIEWLCSPPLPPVTSFSKTQLEFSAQAHFYGNFMQILKVIYLNIHPKARRHYSIHPRK